MNSSSTADTQYVFELIRVQMLKNTMCLTDVELNCSNTQGELISSSNVETHNVVEWFRAQMLNIRMILNKFELKCWTSQWI